MSRFAALLRDRSAPVVVGIDRNSPKWERHVLAEDEWWNKWEPLLFGVERVHDLRDVYRVHLQAHPELAHQVRIERPDGPPAVAHLRCGIACRYDAIYASSESTVENVEHHWDNARRAGSDHALVRATLAWHPDPTSTNLAIRRMLKQHRAYLPPPSRRHRDYC